MAYCSNCGVKLDDGMKFCPDCGAAIVGKHVEVPMPGEPERQEAPQQKRNVCSKCGGTVKYETVTEEQARGVGCLGTICIIVLGIFLVVAVNILIAIAVIVVGILIFSLGSKNEKVAVTYSVCQNCGYREKVRND